MGSWGVRMRESDAALDGIYRIEHEYPPSAPFTWEILKWYFEHGLGEEFEPRTWDIEKPKDDINPADDWADEFVESLVDVQPMCRNVPAMAFIFHKHMEEICSRNVD